MKKYASLVVIMLSSFLIHFFANYALSHGRNGLGLHNLLSSLFFAIIVTGLLLRFVLKQQVRKR